ncbi:RHS repeat-associated core domain-containing protein [Myxococcus sp. Y35]|uniref:RHS repeat-associated core domain-containing protein n=1 Tax=Pseudomyxococcus flavus TaxID=3115648 RepID=UPI003CE91755
MRRPMFILLVFLTVGTASASSPDGHLSQTAPTGNTGGYLAVTSTGQAVTSIPLQVPPGIGALSPTISLNYSSNTESGELGVGFSLAATSSIKRCGRIMSDDAALHPITFRDEANESPPEFPADWLCLDGMRLIGLKNGLKIGRVYRKYSDDGSRVIARTSDDGRPGFELQLPDGSIHFYGTDDQSRVYSFDLDAAGGPIKKPYEWKLTRVRDPHDNAMTYHYVFTDNLNDPLGTHSRLDHRLSEIRYVNNTRRVTFQYERLPEQEVFNGFFSMTRYRQSFRLKRIATFAPSAIATAGERMVRQYVFTYANNTSTTKRSLLQSLQECVQENGAAVCKRATEFTWQAGGYYGDILLDDKDGDFAFDEKLFPVHGIPEQDHEAVFQLLQLDGNQDGTTDLLVAPWWEGNGQAQNWSFWAIRPSPQESEIIDTGLPVRAPLPIPQEPVEVCDHANNCRTYLLPGDAISSATFELDGDDRTDVLVPFGDHSDRQMLWGFAPTLQVLRQTPGLPQGFSLADTYAPYSHHALLVAPGDFNGDGLSDLMVCAESDDRGAYFDPQNGSKTLPPELEGSTLYQGYWVYLENRSYLNPYTFTPVTLTKHPCSALDKVHVMDFDGDGTDNLLTIRGYDARGADLASKPGDWPPLWRNGSWFSPEQLRGETYQALVFHRALGQHAGESDFYTRNTGLPFDYYQRLHAGNGGNRACLDQYGALCRGNGIGADKVGDVNGDGFPDVVRFESEATLAANGLSPFVNQTDGALLPDAGAAWEGRIEVWLNIGGYFVRSHDWMHTLGATSFHAQFLSAHLVDWDRDGRDELLIRNGVPSDTNAQPMIIDYPSQGGGTLEWSMTTLPPLPWKLDERALSLGDYNADGLTDVLVRSRNPDNDSDPYNDPWLLDFHVRQGDVPDLMQRLTNGNGASWMVLYKPMSDTDVYREAFAPFPGLEGAIEANRVFDTRPLAAALLSPTGVSPTIGSRRTEYFYKNAQQLLQGHQFLGFEHRSVRDAGATGPDAPFHDFISWRLETYATRTALINHNGRVSPHAGKLLQSLSLRQRQDSLDGALAVLTQNRYTMVPRADFHGDPEWQVGPEWFGPCGYQFDQSQCASYFFSTLTRSSEVRTFEKFDSWLWTYGGFHWTALTPAQFAEMADADVMQGIFPLKHTKRGYSTFPDAENPNTTHDYDELGFPKRYYFEDLSSGARYETELTYEHRLDTWNLGLVLEEKVTHKLPGALPESRTRTVQTTYTATGEPDVVTVEPTLAEYRFSTRYGYDSFGNTTAVQVWDGEGNDRGVSIQYAPDGVFPVTFTNALGHTSTRLWEPGMGLVLSSTAPDGVKSISDYDGFGRPTFSQTWSQGAAMTPGTSITYEPLAFLPPRVIVESPGLGYSETTFDELGRPVQSVSKGFKGEYEVFNYAQYDYRGRLVRVSHPAKTGESPVWTRMEYDVRDRLIERISPGGIEGVITTRWRYDGLKTTQIDPDGNQTWLLSDTRGNIVRTADGHKADAPGTATEMCYRYGHFEGLYRLEPCQPTPLRAPTQFLLDLYNRRLMMDDKQTGLQTFDYDPLGQLRTSLDAKGQTLIYEYDDLGRPTTIVDSEGGSATWTYDVTRPGFLHQSVSRDGHAKTHLYDVFGRPTSTDWTIDGEVFRMQTAYDAFGRPGSLRYPSNFIVTMQYDDFGNLLRLNGFDNRAAGFDLWEQLRADPFGGVEEERFGNGIVTTRTFDEHTGRLESIRSVFQPQGAATTVQDLRLEWTKAMDLRKRIDALNDQSEFFLYDPKHRLLGTQAEKGASTQNASFSYDPFGNLLDRPDVGTYTYQDERLQSAGGASFWYNDNGELIARSVNGINTALTHDPHGRVTSIFSLPAYELKFDYDADGNRVRRFDAQSGLETLSIGEWYRRERDVKAPLTSARHTHLVKVGAETVAELTRVYDTQGNIVDSDTHFLLTDELGSTTVVTDDTGAVVERRSYTAWGQPRDPLDWTQSALFSTASLVTRGFTGHEGRDDGGFTFMRGRMYDPSVGRFISPDPIVQAPFMLADLNRYSYAWNNPVSVTDPTGLCEEGEWSGPGTRGTGGGISIRAPGGWGCGSGSGGGGSSDPLIPEHGGDSGPGSGGGGGNGGAPSLNPGNSEHEYSQPRAAVDPVPVPSNEAAAAPVQVQRDTPAPSKRQRKASAALERARRQYELEKSWYEYSIARARAEQALRGLTLGLEQFDQRFLEIERASHELSAKTLKEREERALRQKERAKERRRFNRILSRWSRRAGFGLGLLSIGFGGPLGLGFGLLGTELGIFTQAITGDTDPVTTLSNHNGLWGTATGAASELLGSKSPLGMMLGRASTWSGYFGLFLGVFDEGRDQLTPEE